VSAATACDRVFAAGGPLSDLLPGYAPRAAQRAMAAAVERAVSERGVLICEAGTGTGKTLAYLVPAVAAGEGERAREERRERQRRPDAHSSAECLADPHDHAPSR